MIAMSRKKRKFWCKILKEDLCKYHLHTAGIHSEKRRKRLLDPWEKITP